jgi:hypothetical protein
MASTSHELECHANTTKKRSEVWLRRTGATRLREGWFRRRDTVGGPHASGSLRSGTDLLLRPQGQLPSALTVLTAEFGMGSGVTPSGKAPERNDRNKENDRKKSVKSSSRCNTRTVLWYFHACARKNSKEKNVQSPVRIARLNTLLYVHLRPI